MPNYPFKCKECDKEFDRVFSMKDAPTEVECECGGKAKRNWKEYGRIGTNARGYPHWSGAMGVNISRIGEYKKYYPDAVFNKRGDILVKSRKHKKELMKQRNMVELD
jgi:putative FmdB family regulatory protein